jgi:putative membrane protein
MTTQANDTAKHAKSKTRANRIRGLIILLGLATVPMIYSGLLTSSFSDPQGNLHNIPAAVVNEDEPASANDTTVNIGAELTDRLVDSDDESNFTWQEMPADEAQAALVEGDVLAVLTIPEDFSSNTTSVAGDDPQQAKLRIQTNDATSMFAGTIANQIGTVVADELKAEVSDEYLQNIYAGFTNVHDQLSEASDGSSQVTDGLADAGSGANDLEVGLETLVSGTGELAAATDELATGASTAQTGANTLANGASQLDTGAGTLADGAATVNNGMQPLASGATDANDGAQQLADGTASLETGAGDLADGAEQVAAGTQQLADAVNAAADAVEAVRDSVEAVTNNEAITDDAEAVVTGLGDLRDNWATLTDEERLAALETIAGNAENVHGGVSDAVSGLEGIDLSALEGLGSGSDLVTQVNALNTGAQQVATGAGDLESGAATAADGAATLAAGTADLASGADDLADGTQDLASGAATLAEKTGELATGAGDLAAGAATLADGAGQIASGASELDEGAQQAASGSTSLSDGLAQLYDGSDELTSGLESGTDEVPSYTDAESERLAAVAGEPVTLDATREHAVEHNAEGMAPYFMSLALWVGGMAYFMMKDPLARARGTGSLLLDALRSVVPGAIMGLVQSTLMLLVLHFWVGVNYALAGPLIALVFFASITFVVINQSLVALLGPPGRYLALVMIVLQLSAAGATYPVQTTPQLFQTLHPWLPISHTVEAFRALIAGSTIRVDTAVWYLAIWLVGALVLLVAAVAVQRRRQPAERGRIERSVTSASAGAATA